MSHYRQAVDHHSTQPHLEPRDKNIRPISRSQLQEHYANHLQHQQYKEHHVQNPYHAQCPQSNYHNSKYQVPQQQSHSHYNVSYFKQQSSVQYSYHRYQEQLQQIQHYHQMPSRNTRASHKHASATKPVKSRSKHTTKRKEKPLLNQSCSLPEDDEVLRASVFLLQHEPDVTDGYSSDNALFYGKISIAKPKRNHKTKYLKKLGKEVLTNNPKFNIINSKDELAIKGCSDSNYQKTQNHTLYNALTKRLSIERDTNHDEINSDDSWEKVRRTERDRKQVIRTRQKMRRKEANDKSYLFFRYGSAGAVLCNLSASTLGCSVLCVPYVFSLCGCLYGCVVIMITVLLQLISMRLLLQCQKCTGVSSIQMLTILYLKNKCGVMFINSIIFGYCFTQCIAILIALADLIQPVFRDYITADSFLANRSFLLVVVTLFVLLPLSFHDKPPHLSAKQHKMSHKKQALQNMNRWRDCLYNMCMIYFLSTIIVAAVIRIYNQNDQLDLSLFESMGVHMGIYMDPSASITSKFYSMSLGFPIVLYCLTTHTELFKVNDKLSSRNKSKLYHIAHGTLIVHALYILVLGICGYIYFCDNPNVATNIILNLKHKCSDLYISIAMAVIGVALFLFYPSVLQPSTHSMSVLIFANERTNITQHILLTFFLNICALVLALWITDLATLFAWSGAIFCSILSLILPGLLFWNIIVFPSKTFVHALMNYKNVHSPNRKTSTFSKYNINTQSKLNSIIATATPPLMNYARTVNDEASEEIHSSLLSASQLSYKVFANAADGLPNIMTADAFNQTIADSYSRLYGDQTKKNKTEDVDIEQKYNRHSFDSVSDMLSPSASRAVESTVSDINITASSCAAGGSYAGIDFNSEYVSLSSHTKRKRQHIDIEEVIVDNYGGDNMSKSTCSHTKTHNLKEASKSIQNKIETQLKQDKIQRIIAVEKVNQSWRFWFDRIGAILVLFAGVILFIVGNVCNILHIMDNID